MDFSKAVEDHSIAINKVCENTGYEFCGGLKSECELCSHLWIGIPREKCDICDRENIYLSQGFEILTKKQERKVHAYFTYYCEICIQRMNNQSTPTGISCQNCFELVDPRQKQVCKRCKKTTYCSQRCHDDDLEYHQKFCR